MLGTKIMTGILIVLGAGSAFSQEPSNGDSKVNCSFSEAFRKDGWTVPGVRGAKVVRQRSALTNMPGVFMAMLEPAEAETNLTDIHCLGGQSGRLEIGDIPIKILKLWSFDYGGAIFAYRLEYADEAIQDGERGELGSESVVMFYDIDGSGRFTLMAHPKIKGTSWFMPTFIPDWAKNSAARPPAK